MPFGERPSHIQAYREVSRLLHKVEALFGRVVEVKRLARVGVYLQAAEVVGAGLRVFGRLAGLLEKAV